MARRAADSRLPDDRGGAARGVLRSRAAAARWPPAPERAGRSSRRRLAQADSVAACRFTCWRSAAWRRLAPSAARCRTWRSTSVSIASCRSRRSTRILSLVLVGSLIGRLVMGWLADRWPRKRRDDADLRDRRAARFRRCSSRRRARRLSVAAFALRHRAGRRLHDHPADGRRSVWPRRHGTRHGRGVDGGQRRGVTGADAGGGDSRSDGQLRGRLPRAGDPGGGRCGGGQCLPRPARAPPARLADGRSSGSDFSQGRRNVQISVNFTGKA